MVKAVVAFHVICHVNTLSRLTRCFYARQFKGNHRMSKWWLNRFLCNRSVTSHLHAFEIRQSNSASCVPLSAVSTRQTDWLMMKVVVCGFRRQLIYLRLNAASILDAKCLISVVKLMQPMTTCIYYGVNYNCKESTVESRPRPRPNEVQFTTVVSCWWQWLRIAAWD